MRIYLMVLIVGLTGVWFFMGSVSPVLKGDSTSTINTHAAAMLQQLEGAN